MPDHSSPRPPTSLSRRDVLVAAGGAVLGAGAVGFGVGVALRPAGARASGAGDAEPSATDDVSAAAEGPALRRFTSTDLTAPEVTVWRRDGAVTAAGLLFTSPRTDLNNGVIYDDQGEPVWIEPTGQNVTDLRVQQYGRRPVLTHWSGKLIEGYGVGSGVILDETYREIARVSTGRGVQADLHEFLITPRGTAYLIAYPVQKWDLRAVEGPEDGFILGSRIQEVDIATGDVLFDWDGMDHIDLDESYQPLSEERDGMTPATALDPIHFNSIEEDGDALLLSARHTHAIYSLDRTSGDIRWRLGGKRSDFDLGDGVDFSFQHDARRRGVDTISIFDNHGSAGTEGEVSSGMLLEVDEDARTARLAERFDVDDYFGFAQGNLQVLENGNVLVGWGSLPTATEFTADGTAIFEVRELGTGSYRVYRFPWSGRPLTRPDIGFERRDGAVRVFASWNGATDVSSWRFLAGSAGALEEIGTVERDGFETSTDLPDAAVVAVQALDANGTVLGESAPLSTE